MKLPASNHIVWLVVVIGLLIACDTLTSIYLYENGYEVSKDGTKTFAIVTTVLVPLLAQHFKQSREQ